MKIIAVLAACLCLSCGTREAGGKAEKGRVGVERKDLRLGAAISLSSVLDTCIHAYKTIHPDIDIHTIYSSAGSLQRQIENGAPIDVFISASAEHMNRLEEKNLVAIGTRRPIVRNSLVVIVPKERIDSPSFADLSLPATIRVALGEFSSVPAGRYAEQVFAHEGVLEEVLKKTVYAKDVRQVLYYVESGEVDAGVVYSTEAIASTQVRITARAKADTHEPIIYPGAAIAGRGDIEQAVLFLDWLSGPEAQELFHTYGFDSP
ncbi:MAG: molybdate ABC transporter substrate-binding protein [Spirochaetales bacterium]|nr:molybdate ABC transporter substrate-binding protein [Spirochaetales bacterium]